MGNKTRHTANLVSDNNIFVDIASDRVGIGSTQPTAKLNIIGIVSATSFRGDGSQLSGISVDSSSLVDSNSATRVQANTSGAVVTGILTATQLFGDASNVTGIVTTNLGKANVTIGDNPPGIGTAHGDLWWESDTAKGHIYYNDGSSAQWVEFSPSSGGSGGGGSYGNSDVDAHLNVGTASTGEVLSWNGSDYDWVAQSGGGGGGGDAATLDTLDSTQFLRSDFADEKTAGDLTFNDSVKLNLGTHGDMSIFFNGSHTFMDASVGNINIRTVAPSGGDVIIGSGTSDYFRADSSTGESILYHYGNQKLATKSDGIDVTGHTETDTLNVSGIVTASSFVGDGSALTGIGTVVISDNAPSSPDVGQLWWESDTATGHIYYNDGSTSQWVQFNSGSGGSGSSSGVGTSRFTASNTTGSIGAGTTADITISGAKAYSLFKIETSHAAWVRLYTDTTSRTNDASRAYTTDPTPGSGVLAEVYTTTSGSNTFKMTPAVTGWNDDATPSTNIYAKVTNNESTSQDITVTLTILRMED